MSSVDEEMRTVTIEVEPTKAGLAKDGLERVETPNIRGHGQFWLGIPHGGMTKDHTVVASITEMGAAGPVKGQARMQVSNVVPSSNLIEIWCNIDAPSDRTFRVQYFAAPN
ncbi:hypothetical protein ACIQNT_00015 [Streptomyces luteogriseus]|uniref:Uncharacterized protein n=1 Tax=Streptomyces luteogriseus TaxID=68233 RepID=A0A7W7DW60_9ACTN|nr:hypothetical protein [Streptomyces luteogriseus]MBB4717778.1 hypothetical protein [Streptomyces luteogriseus]